jgi:hypothetical protein
MAFGDRRAAWMGAAVSVVACGDGSGREDTQASASISVSVSAEGSDGATSVATADDDGTTASPETTASDGPDTGTIFDLGALPDGGGGDTMPTESCKVIDDMDAVGDCKETAPPESFEPDVQWTWPGENGEVFSIATPLVANLTDDNADGEIDLCDIPDVVVVAWASLFGEAHIYVLDGETGTSHFRIETPVDTSTCPALGDIDGDGLPEIVMAQTGGTLVAFEHDGTLKWTGSQPWTEYYIAALALADLDNDGDVEIIAGRSVYDHMGQHVVTIPGFTSYSATTAADLDDDGDLELVLGNSAYHHDGTLMWSTALGAGFPQVGNLDGDPEPEVLLTNNNGLSLIDHDGAVQYQDLRPTGDPAGANNWLRPATIHDFDGDGAAEYAVSSANHYAVYESDASLLWSADVADLSGIAAGTAFDFLGDGDAEAMYADESFMFIFDGAGQVLLQSARTSRTGIEYPVVADVDNDGSAEIVVVSNEPIFGGGGMLPPPVQVIRDVDDRWIQARRIWNEHTYHVTNVREDGTIPQVEPHHWELLNTFRTNAQIEGGGLCVPDPEG